MRALRLPSAAWFVFWALAVMAWLGFLFWLAYLVMTREGAS